MNVIYQALFFNILVYVWLRWVFVAVQASLSSCRKQGLLTAVRGQLVAERWL